MDMSIRFPGLKLVLDYVPRSFEVFGFEITIYGILIAAGMLLGIFLQCWKPEGAMKMQTHAWIWRS